MAHCFYCFLLNRFLLIGVLVVSYELFLHFCFFYMTPKHYSVFYSDSNPLRLSKEIILIVFSYTIDCIYADIIAGIWSFFSYTLWYLATKQLQVIPYGIVSTLHLKIRHKIFSKK